VFALERSGSAMSRQKESGPGRLLPDRPLPPYSYVSRRFPHPTRDPDGHSYGIPEPEVEVAVESRWPECEPYLWGIDLFNHGYYWEAHEQWEAVWHAAGRSGTRADFCKALIALAAAGVKAREGRSRGVRHHAGRARKLLDSVRTQTGDGDRFMGLSLEALTEWAEWLEASPDQVIDTSHTPVVVVMPFALRVSPEEPGASTSC